MTLAGGFQFLGQPAADLVEDEPDRRTVAPRPSSSRRKRESALTSATIARAGRVYFESIEIPKSECI
jgi:hypothetical protein